MSEAEFAVQSVCCTITMNDAEFAAMLHSLHIANTMSDAEFAAMFQSLHLGKHHE
jgi:hypothetical protein